jgi:hypothetical protein
MSENTTMIAWMKEVSKSVGTLDKKVDNVEINLGNKIDEGNALLHQKHDVLREEFVIHKTKINTRSALISTAIAASFAIASLVYTISNNRQTKELERDKVSTEQVIEKQT